MRNPSCEKITRSTASEPSASIEGHHGRSQPSSSVTLQYPSVMDMPLDEIVRLSESIHSRPFVDPETTFHLDPESRAWHAQPHRMWNGPDRAGDQGVYFIARVINFLSVM